jgi:cation diffusion facilitator family transporter
MNPSRAAALSVASNTALFVVKLAVGLSTGAVSVISEAIHSGLDLLASLIAWVSVKESARPPDQKHPFGHGKIENVSGSIEAGLIFTAGIWIVVEATRKLIHGGEVESIGLGLGVMGASAATNYFISRRLFHVARQTDSVALEADALHLRTDVYTSAGVFVGLGLLALTGIKALDALAAIAVALLILRTSWNLTREAFLPLLDIRLPEAEEREVEQILETFRTEYVSFHGLRTRKAGAERHVDLHLVVPPRTPIAQAHELAGRVKWAIKDHWPKAHVLVHIEPGPSA